MGGQLIAGDLGNQSPVGVSGLSHPVTLRWRELEEARRCSRAGLPPATELCTCLPLPQSPDHGVAHSQGLCVKGTTEGQSYI